ncbi:O-antigen ligase family protein [Mangrovimicrobium sediminis]|nr:O-antigen ligase family protein [Haliea sp. SAOS-164]
MTIINRLRNYLLDGGMLYLYGAFIAGYFLLPMAAGHRRLYYFLVLPASCLLAPELLAFLRGNRLAHLVLLYAGYMLASLAWSSGLTAAGALEVLLHGVSVLSFVALSGYLWVRYPVRIGRLQRWTLWLAAAAATVSIVIWYAGHPFPASRLEPLGVMHDPNEGGSVYGLCFIYALYCLLGAQERRERVLCAALAAVLLALVLFTQSRTALMAVCAGLLVLAGWRALGLIALAGVASWALLASNAMLWKERVLTFSYRPGIWQRVIEDATEHPWFGRGYLADTAVPAYGKVFNHAHDSYLATVRDGGLVGLALLLAMLGLAALWAWRLRRDYGQKLYLALLVYGATCISMDFDRLLVQPKEIWLFFWLPVALVMASWSKYQQRPAHAGGQFPQGDRQAPG